jgi:hypothetical protein
MIVPLHSPARSQRFAARVTVAATVVMACVVCFSVWRYCTFIQGLPALEATMRGVADDLAQQNGSNAIAAEGDNVYEVGEFKSLTAKYGPVLSYRCVSSYSKFDFPFWAKASQTYDIHFKRHDSTAILTMMPDLSHQHKVDRLWVEDVSPSHVR